jgi:hypothetical protein
MALHGVGGVAESAQSTVFMLEHRLGCGEVGVYSGGILHRPLLVPGMLGFAWTRTNTDRPGPARIQPPTPIHSLTQVNAYVTNSLQ